MTSLASAVARGRSRERAPGRWHAVNCFRTSFGVPDVPALPSVYAIFVGRECVYIGQSNNLRLRFARHSIRYGYARNIITPWGDFAEDQVTARVKISKRYGDWAMWELRLIRRLRRRFNGTFVNGRRPKAA